jgi:hypothetical protein
MSSGIGSDFKSFLSSLGDGFESGFDPALSAMDVGFDSGFDSGLSGFDVTMVDLLRLCSLHRVLLSEWHVTSLN